MFEKIAKKTLTNPAASSILCPVPVACGKHGLEPANRTHHSKRSLGSRVRIGTFSGSEWNAAMMKFAILIDGGFVKAKLGSARKPVSAQDIQGLVDKICVHPLVESGYLYRVYYYDAPPFSQSRQAPLNGPWRNFAAEPLTKHNKRLLDDLKTLDRFALRMGEVRFRGWELDARKVQGKQEGLHVTAADFRPSLQQKGVDMRIGLDIASLALKNQVDMCVLVTGDSDFVPPMKFARREGLQFALVTLGHKVLAAMLEHTDFSLDISP